jgi:hypothetical protein
VSPAVQRHRRRRARGALKQLTAHPKVRIYAAIPQNSARARSQGSFMRVLDQRIDEAACLGQLRCDAATNTRAIAWLMVRYTDWQALTCRIGWRKLVELSGLSRKTVGRVIRRLRGWELLGIVETGSTQRTRGCQKGDTDGNRAAVYVLCVPAREPVDISDPPSLASARKPEKPHARTRKTDPKTTERPWPMHQTPRTRGQRLAATQRLQQQAAVLARIPAVRLRSALRPYFDRGLTPAQVLYALDHGPDGTLRWHTADVRHVPGWIRHRLSAWDGRTPPRQLGAGRSVDLEARDVAQLPAAGERSTVNVETYATPLRQLLTATQKRSDKKRAARRGLGVNLPGRDGEAPATVVEAPVELGGGDGDWLLRNAAALARTTSDAAGRAIA